jgi:ubiquinone/menaquinone biosynthesis C-methylase UbiE
MKIHALIKQREQMKIFRFIFLYGLCVLILVSCTGLAQSSRDARVQPEKLMDAIGVKPGMVIGEAGAGEGYFTFKLSRRVGKTGKIYANDIVERVLKVVERRSEREDISNIATILGEVEDPLFPKGALDMVFMIAAFHDFERKVEWLKNVQPCLKPGGTLVIVETDPDKTGRDHDHFMTKDEILETVKKSGFKLDRIETFLPAHNIYIYKLD